MMPFWEQCYGNAGKLQNILNNVEDCFIFDASTWLNVFCFYLILLQNKYMEIILSPWSIYVHAIFIWLFRNILRVIFGGKDVWEGELTRAGRSKITRAATWATCPSKCQHRERLITRKNTPAPTRTPSTPLAQQIREENKKSVASGEIGYRVQQLDWVRAALIWAATVRNKALC